MLKWRWISPILYLSTGTTKPTGTALAQALAPHHIFSFFFLLPFLLPNSVTKTEGNKRRNETIWDVCQSCQSNPYFERFEMKKTKVDFSFQNT